MKFKLSVWTIKHKVHIIVWVCFIIYESLAVGLAFKSWANPITYISHYLVTVCLFYLYSDYLLPFSLHKKFNAIWLVPLIVFFHLALYVVLHYIVDRCLIYANIIYIDKTYPLNKVFIIRNVYRGSLFLVFATGYYFLRTYLKEKKHSSDLERDRLNNIIKQKSTEQELFKAKNAFLKAQINPHFLFNTLNFIHNKVSASSPEAAEAVIYLSEMMRYAITSGEKDGIIKLEDEMDQVINLISLFKLRKSQNLYLKISFAENVKELQFIPLVLLTLAENMFKHGQFHEEDHEATLNVYLEQELLIFETHNLSQPQKSNRSHTGLENIKNRLIYAYGNQVQFNYTTNLAHYFKLKIGVPVQQLHEYAQ